MELGHGLLILATFLQVASAEANDTGRYPLPPSKVYIKPCQREALLLHPGVIEKQQILHRNGAFWVQYEIAVRDDSEWNLLCDLATGSIVREQKLIDDAR